MTRPLDERLWHDAEAALPAPRGFYTVLPTIGGDPLGPENPAFAPSSARLALLY